MRPFRLELEGFGPYRERQVVDFSDVELFAITGPTGSGKSTLLEAIAFALFKKTPRGQSLEELRHPSAYKVRVVLDFGVGERVYRVVRHLEAQGGRLLSQDQLFRQEGTQWKLEGALGIKELNERLERLLGLGYEAFTRALLLPQGEFDRFLKGEPRERRALLQNLFGLEHLQEARDKARAHLDELQASLAAVEGELQGLGEATWERLEALGEELAALRRELGERKEALGGKRKALEELRRRKEYWTQKDLLSARAQRLKEKAEEMDRLRLRLERAEEARRILPLYDALKAQREALRAILEKQRALQDELDRLRSEEALLEGRLRRLPEVEETLSRLESLKGKEGLLKRLGVGLGFSHPEPLPASEEALFALQAERAQVEAYEKAKEAWEGRKDILAQKEKELQALAGELSELERKGRETGARLEDLKREEEGLKKAALLSEEARRKEELAGLESELQRVKDELEEVGARLDLARHRHLLRPGQPCPLCGQPYSSSPPPGTLTFLNFGQEDLSQKVKALKERERQLLTQRGRWERELEGVQNELKRLEGVDALPFSPERLEALKEEIPRLEEALSELRERYREVQGRYKALSEEVQRLRSEVDRLKPKGAPPRPLKAVEEEWNRRLAGFVQALREATGGSWPSEREGALLREREALLRDKDRLKDVLAEEDRLAKEGVVLEAQEGELRKRLEELEKAVQGLPEEGEVRRFWLSDEEMEDLSGRLREYEEERREVEAALKVLGEPPGPRPGEGEEALLLEEVRALEESISRLEREVGGRENERMRLEKDLKRRRDLEGERARLGREVALWQELWRDLDGKNFPTYLLSYHQRGLLLRASDLLHALSKGRYRLEAQGDRFFVVDAWTRVKRPVHTLSGGETFQASLALALALSERLARGRLMALFLDEGFGTLDPESLEEAAGVLESLPTGGRLVGVVTHVEALAERFPARLRVRKHPSGSRVEWVRD
ncbi:MAG: AAA family ATPase [Thermaceae bacterium]